MENYDSISIQIKNKHSGDNTEAAGLYEQQQTWLLQTLNTRKPTLLHKHGNGSVCKDPTQKLKHTFHEEAGGRTF